MGQAIRSIEDNYIILSAGSDVDFVVARACPADSNKAICTASERLGLQPRADDHNSICSRNMLRFDFERIQTIPVSRIVYRRLMLEDKISVDEAG